MVSHYYQRVTADKDVPQLKIRNIDIERVKESNFPGLTINENPTWNSHAKKICNKIITDNSDNEPFETFPSILCIESNLFLLKNSHLHFCVETWVFGHSRINKPQKWQLR